MSPILEVEELIRGIQTGEFVVEGVASSGVWPFRKYFAIIRVGADRDTAFCYGLGQSSYSAARLMDVVRGAEQSGGQEHRANLIAIINLMIRDNRISDETAILFIRKFGTLKQLMSAS